MFVVCWVPGPDPGGWLGPVTFLEQPASPVTRSVTASVATRTGERFIIDAPTRSGGTLREVWEAEARTRSGPASMGETPCEPNESSRSPLPARRAQRPGATRAPGRDRTWWR